MTSEDNKRQRPSDAQVGHRDVKPENSRPDGGRKALGQQLEEHLCRRCGARRTGDPPKGFPGCRNRLEHEWYLAPRPNDARRLVDAAYEGDRVSVDAGLVGELINFTNAHEWQRVKTLVTQVKADATVIPKQRMSDASPSADFRRGFDEGTEHGKSLIVEFEGDKVVETYWNGCLAGFETAAKICDDYAKSLDVDRGDKSAALECARRIRANAGSRPQEASPRAVGLVTLRRWLAVMDASADAPDMKGSDDVRHEIRELLSHRENSTARGEKVVRQICDSANTEDQASELQACSWYDEDESGEQIGEICAKPAEFWSCVFFGYACEQHKCRCPSSRMARLTDAERDPAREELRFIISYLAHNDQDANHAWMVRRIRAVLAGKDPTAVEPWNEHDGVRKPRVNDERSR